MTTNCTCTVTNCIHNNDRCCCKATIQVDGSHAEKKEATCCASFDEKHGESYKNSGETPDKKLKIECNAVKCIYNADHYCSADKVDINGSSAHDSTGTQCSTFRAKY